MTALYYNTHHTVFCILIICSNVTQKEGTYLTHLRILFYLNLWRYSLNMFVYILFPTPKTTTDSREHLNRTEGYINCNMRIQNYERKQKQGNKSGQGMGGGKKTQNLRPKDQFCICHVWDINFGSNIQKRRPTLLHGSQCPQVRKNMYLRKYLHFYTIT